MPAKIANAVARPPAKKMYEHPEIVSLYYHRLKYAYVSNNQPDVDFFYSALKKALVPENADVIAQALNVRQMADLTKLVDAVQKGVFYCDFAAIEGAQSDGALPDSNDKNWFAEEKDLEDHIVQNFDMVNDLLRTNMTVAERQFQTDHGPMDILATEPRTMYVIELKRGVANHSIVGQVLKYARHFQKRSLYNMWDEVKMICVAGSYDEYTYSQLQALNVATVAYSYDGSALRLRTV